MSDKPPPRRMTQLEAFEDIHSRKKSPEVPVVLEEEEVLKPPPDDAPPTPENLHAELLYARKYRALTLQGIIDTLQTVSNQQERIIESVDVLGRRMLDAEEALAGIRRASIADHGDSPDLARFKVKLVIALDGVTPRKRSGVRLSPRKKNKPA